MSNKLSKFISIVAAATALCTLPLFGCDDGKPNNDPPDDGKGDINIDVGGAVDMVSRISIDLSDDPLLLPFTIEGGGAATFKSDYSSVAAVDKSGMLYSIAVGVANITVSSATASATVEVEVTDEYDSYVRLRTVEDVEDLIAGTAYTKSNNYCLACDIDFGGKTIRPFGGWGDKTKAFNATLDGRGYALKNFKIENPESCKDENGRYFGVSLFPYIGTGVVRNLNLIGVDFTGYGFTGGIAGQLEAGLIENCFVQGRINSTDGFTSSVPSGGLCGIIGAKGKVIDCFMDLDILGGYVFCGFDFGSGSNCAARAESITAVRNGEELPFQTDDTGNGNPDENKQLKEFSKNDCSLLAETQLTSLRSYKFSSNANWAVKHGYMAFIARPDGVAPSWAKISLE